MSACMTVQECDIEPGIGRLLVRYVGQAELWKGSSMRAEVGTIVKAHCMSAYESHAGRLAFFVGGFCLPHELVSLCDADVIAFCHTPV